MVVNKLFNSNALLLREPTRNIVVCGEHVKELLVAVFDRTSSTNDVWMTGRIEPCLQLLEIDRSTLVLVNCSERLSNNVCAVRVQITKHGHYELINTNGSVSVVIKDGKDLVCLGPRTTDSIVV